VHRGAFCFFGAACGIRTGTHFGVGGSASTSARADDATNKHATSGNTFTWSSVARVALRCRLFSDGAVVEIREVTADDVPAVVAHVTEVLAEFGLTFGTGSPTDDQLRGLPGSYRDHGGMFWVAYVDGALVGTAGVFPVEPGTFELRKMYLRPTTRGLGIGKRLLDTCIEWTRAQGGDRIGCDTIDAMQRAIAFYEANGFVRDDSQMRAERCTRGYRLDL